MKIHLITINRPHTEREFTSKFRTYIIIRKCKYMQCLRYICESEINLPEISW